MRICNPDHHQNVMEWSWKVAGYLPITFRWNPSITFRVILLTNKQTSRETDERHSESAYFAKLLLFQTASFTLTTTCQGQMSKVKDTVILVLMHQMRSVQWVEYYLVKTYYYNSRNIWQWPLKFDLDLFPWPLTSIVDLEIDLLSPWCFEEKITNLFFMTSHDAKTAPRMLGWRPPFRLVFLQGTFCNQPDVSFHGIWCVHHLFPCMTGVNFEAICSLIAEI